MTKTTFEKYKHAQLRSVCIFFITFLLYTSSVIANNAKIETVTTNPLLPIGSSVAIKAMNGKYLSSENGTKAMTANRNSIGIWEKFTVVNAGNGLIALKGNNGRYVSSENGLKPIQCNRTQLGLWEKFKVVSIGNNFIALKGNNGKYIKTKNSGNTLICSNYNISWREKFSIKILNTTVTVTPGKIYGTQKHCGSFQPKKLTGTKAYASNGSKIVYQWQVKKNMNGNWTSIQGANSINFLPPFANLGSRWYRRTAKRKGTNKYVFSNVVDIHAKDDCVVNCKPGTISKTQINCGPFQPEELTGTEAYASNGGKIVYQWQVKKEMGGQWKNIQDAHGIKYLPNFKEFGAFWYRRAAKLKYTDKVVYSNVVDIHAKEFPEADVVVTNIDCNSDTGKITFNFNDHPTRTKIRFSIDGGQNYVVVTDNSTTYTFDNLAAGEYDAKIKWGNHQCLVDLGIHIIKNNTISVDAGENQEICARESVTLTAIGEGNILWSTGETTASITVSPETTTTYTVTSTKGNCEALDEVAVTVNTTSVTVEDQEICFGSTATLTAVGEGTVLWSTGETTKSIEVDPKSTTTYSVTLTVYYC
ncbi:hypothetical protein A8C32_01760 [Flavivirga aquatica]|uniref:Ig-like domain-containing protein n=1 Tax=Flavivirga aquatica TaxID=1849968 RepID=A0A1E5TA19_9FLAO|nr:hypothetical protein [Flavivirga aquatica]OEK08214.1 hypothetical protein A8C32_01760 [Flavivirga aquatica]